MRRVGCALVGLLLAGCGGPGSFDGRVRGDGLAVKSAVLTSDFRNNPSPTWLGLSLDVTEHEETCSLRTQQLSRIPSATFELRARRQRMIEVGSYSIVPEAQLGALEDPSMMGAVTFFGRGAPVSATSGTVKLESFELGESANARGSFELDFAGDLVRGSFHATPCP